MKSPNFKLIWMEQTKNIAKRLLILRKSLDISAADLCRMTGLAPNRWSQYESGERRITLGAAMLLCDKYGVTLDWIYRGDESGLPVRLIERMPTAA